MIFSNSLQILILGSVNVRFMFDIYLPCNRLKNLHKYKIPNAKHFASTSHFFEIWLSNGLEKTCFYESPFHLLCVLRTSYNATTQTGARGRRLSNHNVFWKQRILNFFANGPMIFINLRAVSWKVRYGKFKRFSTVA